MAGEVRREVEGDEADPGAPVAGFNADDVLVLLGAGAEFDVVVGGDAGVGVIVVLDVAGEALGGVGGRSHGTIGPALDDIAVACGEVLAVEGEDPVLRVGGLEAGGLDAEMEAAEAHVDVGGVAILVAVVFHGDCAGIGCQANGRGVRAVVGLDLHGAEGRSDIDVVVVAILVLGDVAAGEQKAGERYRERWSDGEGAKSAGHGSSKQRQRDMGSRGAFAIRQENTLGRGARFHGSWRKGFWRKLPEAAEPRRSSVFFSMRVYTSSSFQRA